MKNQKYGPVICDPEKAEKVYGKHVIANDCYQLINKHPEKAWEGILGEIHPHHSHPFELTDGISFGFIREVLV